jgi:sigma-B regulation protein RsbU (phosphoserine phosphatase)
LWLFSTQEAQRLSDKIKAKVLRVLLSTSIGVLILVSTIAIVSIINMRRTVLVKSDQLGATAAGESELALAVQVQQQIVSLAEDKAALTDGKLLNIENQTKMVADIATHIYTHKDQYVPKTIDYLHPDQVGTTIPHIRTAEGVSFNSIKSEIYLAANIVNILRQITVTGTEITTSSYIGGESGYFIDVELAAPGPPFRTNYDARSRNWYIHAKESDSLIWTDIFLDASGRGVSISCAMPFYDLSNGERVFKGVAGNGTVLTNNINKIIASTTIGETGFAFLLNEKGNVIISPRSTGLVTDEVGNVVGEDYLHSPNEELRELAERMLSRESGLLQMSLDGVAVYVAYHPLTTINWSLGVIVPIDEVLAPARLIQQNILSLTSAAINKIDDNIFMILIIMAGSIVLAMAIIFPVAIRLSSSLAAPIISLNEGAKIISRGDLNHKLDVKTGDEIEMLAESFNHMISDIQHITAEKERINSELSVASDIQNDMLPRIFPTFSNNKWFSIFAKMEPAKEVGGDFYDFFYLDKKESKIVLVIADVSGKGVPAALFMVIAKTLIKQQMLNSGDPAEALGEVNKILCVDNSRSMFVTVFIASLDLDSGQMLYANGGHNPPLLSMANQPYQFMEVKKGIPLGMFEQSRYKLSIHQLHPGDKLYLYTDGINEAMNLNGEQFGNKSFLEAANRIIHLPPMEFDEAIRREVYAFANGAEQSDDITTVAVSYNGNKLGNFYFNYEITLPAAVVGLDLLQAWVADILKAHECPDKICNQIEVVTEELFVNIASYAYAGEAGISGEASTGAVIVRINCDGKTIMMQFEDSGIAFNPLEQAMPDIKASMQDRKIGGLGIFLTRKWMDEVSYKKENGKNILTIRKTILKGTE